MSWLIIIIVVSFLYMAHKVDKKQKEYLNKRIDKLEKKIEEVNLWRK